MFCCVGNDDDLRSVVLGENGAFAGMAPGAVFVDHTTASADVARELSTAAPERGLQFIDAPVSGGQAGAQNGALTVMCGGDAATFETREARGRGLRARRHAAGRQRRRPAREDGQPDRDRRPGAGPVGSHRLRRSGPGLDMNEVLAVIGKGAAQSWQMDNRGKTMIEGKFDYGFAVDWMRKDLGLVLDEAKRNGARLPVTALVDQFYADVQQAGGRRWDTSSLITAPGNKAARGFSAPARSTTPPLAGGVRRTDHGCRLRQRLHRRQRHARTRGRSATTTSAGAAGLSRCGCCCCCVAGFAVSAFANDLHQAHHLRTPDTPRVMSVARSVSRRVAMPIR